MRGVLGIHVDDGIGGGDDYFMSVIESLREKYSFGAFNTGEFDFCGIHYRQWRDGSIEMSQKKYMERIDPIQVCRHRRKEVSIPCNRGGKAMPSDSCVVLYSMQRYRPDLTSVPRLEFCNHMIPKACIEDLLEANQGHFVRGQEESM